MNVQRCNKNGIDYDIYADNSQGYFIFTDITIDESDYNQGILVLETRLGPGYDSFSKEQKQELLETLIKDCDNDNDTGSCAISGGKLRKTKRSSRSRKNRRIKKTRRRRGKK